MRAAPLLLLLTTTTMGCLGPAVTVLPGSKPAQPKPQNCEIPFIRTKVDLAYEEIAGLAASGGDTGKDRPEDFYRALRAKACELGADAVIVTQDYSQPGRGKMTAVAIKYRQPQFRSDEPLAAPSP
jgi:hypothetical protein